MLVFDFVDDVRAASHLLSGNTSGPSGYLTVREVAIAASEGGPPGYCLSITTYWDGIIGGIDIARTKKSVLASWKQPSLKMDFNFNGNLDQ